MLQEPLVLQYKTHLYDGISGISLVLSSQTFVLQGQHMHATAVIHFAEQDTHLFDEWAIIIIISQLLLGVENTVDVKKIDNKRKKERTKQ